MMPNLQHPVNIWIIDTPSACTEDIVSQLHQVGFGITITSTGQQALKLMHQHIREDALPQVILLEISLPDINGFEIGRQIKAIPEYTDVPLLFISDRDDLESKVRGFDVGGSDYLVKPFQAEELRLLIRTRLSAYLQNEKLKSENKTLKYQLQEQAKNLTVVEELLLLANRQVRSLRKERIKLLDSVGERRKWRSKTGFEPKLHALTNREAEILKLMASAKSNSELATRLCITESTVRSYRAKIMRKLSLENSFDLMRIAVENFG